MTKNIRLSLYSSLVLFLIIYSSCTPVTSDSNRSDIKDSLDPVTEVTPVTGGENSTMAVAGGQISYFSFQFSDIETNEIFNNGSFEGWCIDWQKPIQKVTYHNIPLYTTFGVEKWKPLNYLLNIKDDILENDPDLTYREIQVVIWKLRGHPEFDLDQIPITDLPEEMRSNGQYNFDREKVNEIINQVNAGYESFDFNEGTKFAVIAETPPDVQTVIAVAE